MEAMFWKMKGTYKYIDSMICCSEFMKTKMDSNPLFASKTIALHNFIDKVEWKEAEKKDYVLYFGRFSEEKGIGTLIEVCKKLQMFSLYLREQVLWKKKLMELAILKM